MVRPESLPPWVFGSLPASELTADNYGTATEGIRDPSLCQTSDARLNDRFDLYLAEIGRWGSSVRYLATDTDWHLRSLLLQLCI
jgi:hypothetical protein